jgi:hypothetical protein
MGGTPAMGLPCASLELVETNNTGHFFDVNSRIEASLVASGPPSTSRIAIVRVVDIRGQLAMALETPLLFDASGRASAPMELPSNVLGPFKCEIF